jgi:hypothetical protein
MIIVHKPEKKVNSYISKIKVNNKNIRFILNNTKFINLKTNSSNNNILKLYITNDENIKNIRDIDDTILRNVIDNNNSWFNNNLDESKIKEYFRYSMNQSHSNISIMMSDVILPVISFNNNQVSSLKDINIKKDYIINVEMEALGLYFYKDKFGIRWIVKCINMYDVNNIIKEDEILMSKEDIENEWDSDINEFYNKLCQDYDVLNAKLKFIENLKIEIKEEYDKVKNMENMDVYWNNSLNIISKKIAKYNNGTLKIK